MRYHAVKFMTLAVVASCLFIGFECSSPEMTSARLYYSQKNYPKAIEQLQLEVQKNPQNEEAWFMLGVISGEQGDLTGMSKAFDAASKISPKHAAEIRSMRLSHWAQNLNAGVNYLERASGDSTQYYTQSVASFAKAIESYPDTSLTFRYLGYAYNNKGDYDSAIVSFTKAWDMGKDVEAIQRAGSLYLIRGDEHKSKFESENTGALKNLKNLEDVKKATSKDRVKDILGMPDDTKKGPKNSTKEDWFYKLYNLTISFDGDKVIDKKFGQPAYKPVIDSTQYGLAQAQYAKAVADLELARAADPKDNVTLQRLLKGYVESNRIEPAVREFEKAVASDTTNLKTNRYILGVLYRTIGRYDDALGQFKEALRIAPNDCEIEFDIAATYYNWGVDMIKVADEKNEQSDAYKAKFEAALPYIEKVSECKKDEPQVWQTLGTIYARLGMQDKAIKAFDQFDKLSKGVK